MPDRMQCIMSVRWEEPISGECQINCRPYARKDVETCRLHEEKTLNSMPDKMSAETFFAKSRECCWLKRSCSRSCLIIERSRQTRQLDCTSSQPLRLLCAWSLTSNQCCDISASVFCWPNPYSAHVCFEPAFSICGMLRSCCRLNRRNSSNP